MHQKIKFRFKKKEKEFSFLLQNDTREDSAIFTENNFNNIIAAEFQAIVLLTKHLNSSIYSLKNSSIVKPTSVNHPISHQNLNWTIAISKCVEICYALYLLKAINDGRATIKQITDMFSEAFNIDLSDYAQSMKFIKKRKRDGLFLKEMTDTLFQFISNGNQ